MSARHQTRVAFVSGVRVIEVSGEIDLSNAHLLGEALEAEREHPRLVLSLERLSYIDSSGLTVLIREQKTRSDAGMRLFVVLPQTPAVRIFEVTQLTQFLETFTGLPAAVEAARA